MGDTPAGRRVCIEFCTPSGWLFRTKVGAGLTVLVELMRVCAMCQHWQHNRIPSVVDDFSIGPLSHSILVSNSNERGSVARLVSSICFVVDFQEKREYQYLTRRPKISWTVSTLQVSSSVVWLCKSSLQTTHSHIHYKP